MRATKTRQILVPIDFSPESERTLRVAKLLAARFHSRLHLVHVVTPLPTPPLGRAMIPFAFSDKQLTATALTRLKELAVFSLSPRRNRCTVRAGAAAETINKIARETGADLIAISTRGYTGLARAFVGSTTERVVRRAPCPVLVVRENEHLSTRQRARRGRTPLRLFRKILVPLDFSERSRVGLDYALGLAREFRASVDLFHSVVIQGYALGDKYTAREAPNLLAQQQDLAAEELNALRDELPESDLAITSKVVVGSLIEQLDEYVRPQAIDLIVTSTHGRSGLRRAFIGSAAEQIVRHALCSVLVVPNRPRRKKANKERA
jgi:nucleotide-binding universal stress UspA family protein